jgi:flagellar hook protein FlgE
MGIEDIANTGMKAAMTNMEVISNNIANANTVGFKKSYTNFSDIYPSSTATTGVQAGLGVSIAGITQDFTRGGFQTTDRNLDLSIGDNSLFILKSPGTGQVSYSRAGAFRLDPNGYLLNGSNRLQGFPAPKGVILAPSIVDLQVPTAPVPATATTKVTGNLNLNANATIPPATFNASDPTSYNFATYTNVFDSLGNSTPLALYYVKSGSNTWNVNAMINGASAGTGTMSFSSAGLLTGTTGLNSLSYTPGTGAATPQALAVDLAGSTQFAGGSSPQPFMQDGFQAGTLSGVNVDNNGVINIQYTNGQTAAAGQIALANFQSPEGLQDIGNMSWIQSTKSGSPIVSQSASTANITTGTLELSNVDLTQEMVNLIGAQHSFQANAQVEQTYNEVMQTIVKI